MKHLLCPGRPYHHVYKAGHLKYFTDLTESKSGTRDEGKIQSKQSSSRVEYQKFIDQLPKFKGIIILFGLDRSNKEIILSVFESVSNLKNEFKDKVKMKDGYIISRQEWIHQLIKAKNLKHVFICPAHITLTTE